MNTTVINQLWRPPTLRTSQDITTCIYIRSSTHIEYGIEILASPGIPGIELEKRYLEYLRIQLTSKNLYLEYRWTFLSLFQTNSSFFPYMFHFSLKILHISMQILHISIFFPYKFFHFFSQIHHFSICFSFCFSKSFAFPYKFFTFPDFFHIDSFMFPDK